MHTSRLSISTAIKLLIASALLSSAAAGAQQAGSTPGGLVGDTLKRAPEVAAPPPANVESQSAAPAPAPAPAGAGALTMQVSSFRFSGNQVYTSLELEAVIADYLNRPVTLLDIYAAADRVAAYYAKDGYNLASVNVPPQKITGGVVNLEISEGRIGKVELEPPVTRDPASVQRYLGVKSGDLYRSSSLEEGMLSLNELPGLVARAIVRPGTDPGTTDVLVRTAEQGVTGAAFMDNYGRDSIGEIRVAASVNFNNPTNNNDQIQLLGLVSDGANLTYGYAGYNFAVGYGGTRGTLSYGRAAFEVEDSNPEVSGDSGTARLQLDFPVVRSTTDKLRFSAAAVDVRSDTELGNNLAPLPGNSITFLELGAAYNHFYASSAVTQLNINLASNFQGQDRAELDAARTQAALSGSNLRGKQLARLELDATHVQPFGAGFGMIGRVNLGVSPDPLSDSQAYSIGGPQSIRGFPASEARGDRGHFGQLTFFHRLTFGAGSLTSRLFADSGAVNLVDVPGDSDEQHLTSAGLGFDLDWSRFSLKLDVSEPAGSRIDVKDGKEYSTRVYGALFVNF